MTRVILSAWQVGAKTITLRQAVLVGVSVREVSMVDTFEFSITFEPIISVTLLIRGIAFEPCIIAPATAGKWRALCHCAHKPASSSPQAAHVAELVVFFVLQIAAIFEFGGAMLLGRVVTSTIAGVQGYTCQQFSMHNAVFRQWQHRDDSTPNKLHQLMLGVPRLWYICTVPMTPLATAGVGCKRAGFNSHQNAGSLNSYIRSNILIREYRDDNLRCVWAPVGGIADPSVFGRQPEIYAYGMVRGCPARHAMVVTNWICYNNVTPACIRAASTVLLILACGGSCDSACWKTLCLSGYQLDLSLQGLSAGWSLWGFKCNI